ncbi:MAG: YdcF family protein, partial [Proteobacteria bacterium]|nr:YdcF family protein [Pseudomonadota bacterium]
MPESVNPNMFFNLSKIFWYVAEPGNFLLILLIIGVLLLWLGRGRAGRWLVSIAVIGAVFFAIVPVGTTLRVMLENRFPALESLPESVDGII